MATRSEKVKPGDAPRAVSVQYLAEIAERCREQERHWMDNKKSAWSLQYMCCAQLLELIVKQAMTPPMVIPEWSVK